MLESNSDLYLDKLSDPRIGRNFSEMIEKLKATAKIGKNKKGVYQQVEALEEKMRPFIEMRPGNETPLDADSSQQPARGVGGLNSAVSPTPGNGKKKLGRPRRANPMDEEVYGKATPRQIDEDDPNSVATQRHRRNMIMDEEEDEQSKARSRPVTRKNKALNTSVQKDNKRDRQPAAGKTRRMMIEEEEDDEEDVRQPDDDEDDDEDY